MQRHFPGFSGMQMNAIECDQAALGKLSAFGSITGITQVDLRNLIAVHFAAVLDLEAHVETAVGGPVDPERRICERAIAQAVTEGEQRLDVLMIEPAVTHVYAFTVGSLMVYTFGGALGIFRVRGRVVLK